MNGMRNIILTLSVMIFVSGCFPGRFTATPGVRGTVTDIETGESISGAIVSIESHPEITTTTDKNGKFTLLPTKEWRTFAILGVPMDYGYDHARLVFEKDGYKNSISNEIVFHPASKQPKEITIKMNKSNTKNN